MTKMLEAKVSGARTKANELRLMTRTVSSPLFPSEVAVVFKLMILFKTG